MKKTTKLGLLGIFASACALNPLNTQALTPAELTPDANGVVTLQGNVTLDSSWVLAANSNIKTIDLNGHTLTRGVRYGYLINSSTDLTIKNGKVVCGKEQAVIDGEKAETSSSSCIRSYGSLTVDGVDVDAYWTALKAEEGTTLSIKNSRVSSQSGTAGTILNYGNATIENSSIKAASVPNGAAIFTMSYADKTGNFGANVLVKGSTVEGYWPVLLGKYDDYSEENGLPTSVSFEGENTIISDGGFLRKDSARDEVTLSISGEVTAPSEALKYLEEGSKLTLNEDLTEEVTIPDGMTLVIAPGVDVSEGKITFEEGALIENRSGKDIVVYASLDGEEKEVNVPDGTAVSKYEEEKPSEPTDPTEPSEPVGPVDPNHPTEEPSDKPSEDIKNPQTFDGVTIYAALAIVSVGGLGLVLKKRLD